MKKAAALTLFVALGMGVPVRASAQADQASARYAAQKHNAKQSRKEMKRLTKERRKLMKSERKAQKKQHHS